MIDSELSALGMEDLVRLQDRIAVVLHHRFGRWRALAFTDIVNSTSYLITSGDVAGQTLQQRHLDLVYETVSCAGGRIMDTAGDGSFSVFESSEQAAEALTSLQCAIAEQNLLHSHDEQLLVRSAIHWGEVLTDDVTVKGIAVNLCARLACIAMGGQILVTVEVFQELKSVTQQRCQTSSTLCVKSFPDPINVFSLEWQDRSNHKFNKSTAATALTKRQPGLKPTHSKQGRILFTTEGESIYKPKRHSPLLG